MKGNFGFATTLLNTLKKYKNNCPVMISSSSKPLLQVVSAQANTARARKQVRN